MKKFPFWVINNSMSRSWKEDQLFTNGEWEGYLSQKRVIASSGWSQWFRIGDICSIIGRSTF